MTSRTVLTTKEHSHGQSVASRAGIGRTQDGVQWRLRAGTSRVAISTASSCRGVLSVRLIQMDPNGNTVTLDYHVATPIILANVLTKSGPVSEAPRERECAKRVALIATSQVLRDPLRAWRRVDLHVKAPALAKNMLSVRPAAQNAPEAMLICVHYTQNVPAHRQESLATRFLIIVTKYQVSV